MLTMLCVVTVAFYFLILRTVPGIMVALLALVATVMLYLPRTKEYFAPRNLHT
jgi:hypothetical protein